MLVRTSAEMAAVLAKNPFPEAPAKWTVAIFLDAPPPRDTLKTLSGRKNEDVRLGRREIYVHYPEGMGISKLKIPAAKTGTAHNMNTIAKLAAMTAEMRTQSRNKCYDYGYGRRAEEPLTRGSLNTSRPRASAGYRRRLEAPHVRTRLQRVPDGSRCGLP